MFRLARLRVCPSTTTAPPPTIASGKWTENSTFGGGGISVLPPAPPGSNPYSMAALKVPTSALRIKNRLVLDEKTKATKRQPVQLQPGPKLMPPRVPSPNESMMSLARGVQLTKDDSEKAQNGIARLWKLEKTKRVSSSISEKNKNSNANKFINNDSSSSSSSSSSSLAEARQKREAIRHQQSMLDLDSFSPEDGQNNFVHKSLSSQATFSGIVVDVVNSSGGHREQSNAAAAAAADTSDDENSKKDKEMIQTEQQEQQETDEQSSSSSMTIFVKEDESSGILIKVVNDDDSCSSNNDEKNGELSLLGSNVIVSGTLRMKRIVWNDDNSDNDEESSSSETNPSLPNHYTIPILRRTKPMIILPSLNNNNLGTKKEVEEMLSKVTMI